MKKIILHIAAFSFIASASYAQSTVKKAAPKAATVPTTTLDRSIRPKAGPAPEIKLGKTEQFTLANGLKVFVVENHKLPTLDISIQFDTKPALEGKAAGLSQITGELMTSGTKTKSKDELSSAIDNIGAEVNASTSGISAGSLKKHQTALLEILSDILINADFKQDEFEKAKKQLLAGLESSKNEPDAMLNNVTSVINFGKNHPYGEVVTDKTVANIELAACTNYFQTYVRPNVAYMAIVGDVTLAEIKPLIEKYFNGWQRAEVPVANYPTPTEPENNRVVFAAREGAVQSVFNVTYPIDIKPGTEDVIKLNVTNTILGGGSQGRLFLNLREKHGWTYGSYSSVDVDDIYGNFKGYAKCRNVVTDSSITELLAEMRKLNSELVPNEDLQNIINNMSGAFALGLENPGRIAQFAINIDRYKMPKDYYNNYLKNLAAVTPQDVKAMAEKYINPDNANIIVVGSKEEVAPKLKAFASNGTIDYVDNYGNAVENTTIVAAPAGVTAESVYNKHISLIGGEKVIATIKDVKTVFEAEMQGMVLNFSKFSKAGKLKSTVSVPKMGMTFQKSVINGTTGYSEAQGQKKEMTAEEIAEKKEELDPQAEIHQAAIGNTRTLKGQDGNMYVIEVKDAKGETSKEFYDIATGFKVKEVKTQDTPQGPMSIVVEYGDYKEVPGKKGYKVAYTVKYQAGPQAFDMKLTTIEINKGISDEEFK